MSKNINKIIRAGFDENIKLKSEILESDLVHQIEQIGLLLIDCLKKKERFSLQEMVEVFQILSI